MTTDDFTPTYDLYGDVIFRYCVWKCRDREIGQDLMQETFLRFYLCLQREEQIQHARALLYRIAHNLFIDHVRRRGKRRSISFWRQDSSRPATPGKKRTAAWTQSDPCRR